MAVRITCDGDAAGGWMVEIHDGERAATYSPVADRAQDAILDAMSEHWPAPTGEASTADDANGQAPARSDV